MVRHLFILLSFNAFMSSAFACSCSFDDEPAEIAALKAKDKSSAVFVGEVIEEQVVPSEDSNELETQVITYRVIEPFKGVNNSVFVTKTIVTCCLCGLQLKKGKTYLVYAYEYEKKHFGVSICSRTSEVGDAVDDIKALRQKNR